MKRALKHRRGVDRPSSLPSFMIRQCESGSLNPVSFKKLILFQH